MKRGHRSIWLASVPSEPDLECVSVGSLMSLVLRRGLAKKTKGGRRERKREREISGFRVAVMARRLRSTSTVGILTINGWRLAVVGDGADFRRLPEAGTCSWLVLWQLRGLYLQYPVQLCKRVSRTRDCARK
jgi:hypothetical protein